MISISKKSLILLIAIGIIFTANACIMEKTDEKTNPDNKVLKSEIQSYILQNKSQLDIMTTKEASDLFCEYKNKFINVANYFREFEKPSTYCFLTEDNQVYASENVENDEIDNILTNTEITCIESVNNMFSSEKESYEYYTEFFIHKYDVNGYSLSEKGYCQSIVYDPNDYKYKQLLDYYGNAYNFVVEREDLGDDWFLYLYYFNGIKDFDKLARIAYNSLNEVSKAQLPENWQDFIIITIEEISNDKENDDIYDSWLKQNKENNNEAVIKVTFPQKNSMPAPIYVYINPATQTPLENKTGD